MTDAFLLESVSGGTKLEFSELHRYGDGTESYSVRLFGGPVSAGTSVFDLSPAPWNRLFRDLARSWKGWTGTKRFGSLEGDLHLSCRSDSLGHVMVRVSIRGDRGGTDWLAEDTIVLEAGQLEAISKGCHTFFSGTGKARRNT